MTLFGADAFDSTHHPREIAPGAVHLPGWLPPAQQVRFATAFDDWSNTPVPIRPAELPGGHRMSVETVCLGWHWRPYRYSRTADDVNGRRVRALPGWLAEHAAAAVSDASTAIAPELVTGLTRPWSTITEPVHGWACTKTTTNWSTNR
jgi:alkylated DNA repair dioxygenase AlkB